MALYDNRHWLLSQIRKSFITEDKSGMCEAVMTCDNIAKQLPVRKHECYPCVEPTEVDDLDAMARSLDLNSGFLLLGNRRHRSYTAHRLEKMEGEKRKSADALNVRWVENPRPLSPEARTELFPKKDLTNIKQEKQTSLLTELLEKYPNLSDHPFKKFAKMDGKAQIGLQTNTYYIYVMLFNEEDRNYPMEVVVVSSGKVNDVTGFIGWKLAIEHPEIPLKESVYHYGLYIAEDDGTVDLDFPCLDYREPMSKFGFTHLAFAEREKPVEPEETNPIIKEPPSQYSEAGPSSRAQKSQLEKSQLESQFEEELNLNRVKGDIKAIVAPVFQSFNVMIYNKVRAKSEIHLGISGEKLELFPVVQSRISARFWGGRQKARTFPIEDIVSCDIIEHKSNNKSSFRLVYSRSKDNRTDELGTIKHRDFETGTSDASDIVRKVNQILELRQSEKRREYLANRERKSQRKKSFHLGSR